MGSDNTFNIYCDESCHLLHDHNNIMALGALTAPKNKIKQISKEIRQIKIQYKCRGELKWTKVSHKNTLYYIKLVEYFFNNADLSFRSLIVNNKHALQHNTYNSGSHDLFYYKMYFYLLRNIIEKTIESDFEIYLDIKDTHSSEKVYKLNEVLANNFHDFEKEKITKIQQIRSHESELLQLSDFLLGAITYTNRDLYSSDAKISVSQKIKQQLGINLKESTPPWETKFNLFHFSPRDSY